MQVTGHMTCTAIQLKQHFLLDSMHTYVYISQHCEACTLWQQTLEGLCTRCNADTDIQLKQHCCVHTHTHARTHARTHTHTCRHFFVLLAQFKSIVQDPGSSMGPCFRGRKTVKKGLDGQSHTQQPWGKCCWVPWPYKCPLRCARLTGRLSRYC